MMHYDFVAIPETEVPQAVDPTFEHCVHTYASETNKTAAVWRSVSDEWLDYRPHKKTNSIRGIMVHQLLSERRFFCEFAALDEPPVEDVLPTSNAPTVQDYLDKYIWLAKRRLPQFAQGTMEWWMESRPFFDGLERQRIWIFWRRLLHTCHHRTQIQTWVRLLGGKVTCIYGPSGDVHWETADPTYSLDAARRGPT